MSGRISGIRPGNRVLYRDGDRFGVARVDLVGDRHVTGFPFDMAARRWSRRNRRIAADFVIGKLPAHNHTDRIADQLETLRQLREAERQRANREFEERVRALAAAEISFP